MDHKDQDLVDIVKGLRPEVTREQLYAVVEALHEAIEAMLETPEEDDMEGEGSETETETENPSPVGNEIEDSNSMANTWPVAKVDGQTDLEAELRNGTYTDSGKVTKSIWSGIFK